MPTAANNPNDAPVVDKDGIPIHAGPGLSECCWVGPGEAHNLSCEHVTAEQFATLLARQNADRSA